MNASLHRQLARRKRKILRRLEHQPGVERPEPMMAASNIHYELTERTRAIAPGGIGAIHLLAQRTGIVMSPRWRLLGPMEAMDGILMSGLSTAILFSVLHRLVDRRLAIHQSAHGLISAENPMKRLGNDPYAQGNEGI